MTEQTPDGPPVEPLAERIESTHTHDPYITKRFLAIMEHEDNADVTRAFTVGLAINDVPAEPAAVEEPEVDEDDEDDDEDDGPAVTLSEDYEPAADDGVRYEDAYGDTLVAMYGVQECEAHGAEPFVVFRTDGGRSVIMAIRHVTEFAEWLQSRVEKGGE
jgi:hypothetical protein